MTIAAAETIEVHGHVAPGFEPVRDRFAANFTRDDVHREVGAAFAAYHRGRCVVDLWAGSSDAAGRTPWNRDTLVNVWSTTKGVAAIALARLVDQGLVDYAQPAARYWPEFAQAGKAEITVSQLMSHQAGLPGFVEPTPLEDFYDWEKVTTRLAAQAPMWPPGTMNSYHAMTYGFLAGEIVRRVSGRSVGRYLAEEIAGPLDADVHIGLSALDELRVAPLIAPREEAPFDAAAMPPQALAAMVNPQMQPTLPNDHAWRAAEVPAGNGHATAEGLARIYGALANGGELDGVQLMRRETIAKLTEVQTRREDLLLGFRPFWAQGVAVNDSGMLGPSPTTFGHSGWGGSLACGDLEANVAMAYVMNQMGPGLVGDPRAVALCHSVFDCLQA